MERKIYDPLSEIEKTQILTLYKKNVGMASISIQLKLSFHAIRALLLANKLVKDRKTALRETSLRGKKKVFD